MPCYVSTYPLPDGSSRKTQVYARDLRHLDATLARRQMGERPWGDLDTAGLREPEMGSDLLRRGNFCAAMHAMIWTSMIATRAGIRTAWELLNDQGLTHELAHVVHSNGISSIHPGWMHETLAAGIEALEREIPGHHPDWGRQPAVAVAPRADEAPATDLDEGVRSMAAKVTAMEASLRPRKAEPAPVMNVEKAVALQAYLQGMSLQNASFALPPLQIQPLAASTLGLFSVVGLG